LPPLYRAGGNCPSASGGASTWREKLTLAISNNLAHPELELVLHLAIAIYLGNIEQTMCILFICPFSKFV
jgi:hypothetical protein